ncbi:unnamed protein product [Eruca vesicaria subsp. sativa]|uniref:Protochlorophyllide reductase n=1 Tax=Eruca vesicaria subsp. sativa TaxID=29727 RepID=A0ABC8M713_ERUVS|nr:unnamed protein product [Eruca vesicaria subsp. sativa]
MVDFAGYLKADKLSTLITVKEQRRQSPRFPTVIRPQTVTATPPTKASPEQKKTQRKGTAVITRASSESAKQIVDSFCRTERPLDVLVCNAAVYQPTAKEPSFTAEGFELSVGTNHVGHFLLSRLLLDDLKKSDYPSKRMIIVGSWEEIQQSTV